VEASFLDLPGAQGQQIRDAIGQYHQQQATKRISTSKIEWAMGRLADLRRADLKDSDAHIYQGYYALVMENGHRVVKPMRYQCRPAGKPAINDVKFPGTYNARRDNLEGFWRGQFGHTHGPDGGQRLL
jgi:hypothetical protein